MLRSKWLAVGLVLTTGILVVSSLIWPMSQLRDESTDRAIESDFNSLYTSINKYTNEHGRLPNSLSDITLKNGLKNRAEKYSYEFQKNSSRNYELCAKFKTDTTGNDKQQLRVKIPETINNYNTARSHSKGFDCIKYENYSYFMNSSTDSVNVQDSFGSPVYN